MKKSLSLLLAASVSLFGLQAGGTLPDPDGKEADMSKPVQVFILMGQSNMLGFGKIKGDKDGTLEHATKKKGLYPHLVDDKGNWTTRKDVRNVRVMNFQDHCNEWMSPGGANVKGKIGPELGIGYHLGEHIDAPVLILKSCIGNRSLGWDLLPPGSPRYTHDGKEVAGYREYNDKGKVLPYKEGVSKVIGTKGRNKGKEVDPWYAGKQYDSDIGSAKKVLENLDKYYPGAKKYEVAGFLWWQGDKDMRNPAHFTKYEHNLGNLLKSLRKDFKAPNAKFVTASLGQTKKGSTKGDGQILTAMENFAKKNPKDVAFVYTHPLSKGSSSSGHYGGNAETYQNVGEAMGAAMVKLLK